MPEQPPDPLHYDMRIPPPPDPDINSGSEKTPRNQDEAEAGTPDNTSSVRGDENSQADRTSK